jgi:MoaA/NifB/PqqE/SkfB family radical SAM enzyme
VAEAVILVQPPLRVARDFIDYPYHCDLGAVQAAAVARSAGLEAEVVDGFALPGSDLRPLEGGYVLMGAPADEVIAAPREPGMLVVAYTPFHRPPARDPVLAEVLHGLRQRFPDRPIVLADLYQSGQHYVEAAPDDVLAAYPEADILLKYEAEAGLAELCRSLLRRGRPERPTWVRGVSPACLDELAPPAWDLVDLPARDRFLERVGAKLGRGPWAFPVDGRTLPAISSRGCPHRCIHCSSNPGLAAGEAKSQRRYSPAYLARLVGALAREHGATRIHVLDEMVNVSRPHFEALLEAVAAHGLRVDFPNGMRADAVTPQHIRAMAGRVTTLSVSAESGVQRVVSDVVEKRLDLSAIERVLGWAQAADIPTLVHFIIGMPGESRREINDTLEYAVRLHDEYGAWPAVQYATPLPGTRLEALSRRAGPLPEVDDYGPLFQHRPVTRGVDFGPEDLAKFKRTFDQRIAAGQGTKKLIVNVTYRCNNRCTFCAVGNRSPHDGDFKAQCAVLVEYRGRGVKMVDFDGGEPTLYPELRKLIRFARRIGYERVNVTTNGRLCVYEDFARSLTHSGLTTLLFSVHGPDAVTHTRQVGVAEAFDQTCEGIRNCERVRPSSVELGMNVTITRGNHEALPEVAQLAWDLGLRWMNLQFLTPFGRATTLVNPDTAEAAKIAMGVIDRWRDRMKFQVINLPWCFMPGYEEFLVGDLLKLERHMHFVNSETVNLFEYLRERRKHAEVCHGCPHKVFCGGFYDMKDVPEPPGEFVPVEGTALLDAALIRNPLVVREVRKHV